MQNRQLNLAQRNYESYQDSFFRFEESPLEIRTYTQFVTNIPDFLLPLLKAYVLEKDAQQRRELS